MNAMIDTLCALGQRLERFGQTPETVAVVEEACRANAWFTPDSIHAAVEAIRREMLDRTLLEEWLAPYAVPVAKPKRVLIIMAGNLPLVGFFDLLCLLVSGHEAWIKPSSKDTVLMRYVVDLLREADPEIPILFYDGEGEPDAVIATGSDNTNRYFRARYGSIPTLLRGSRQSVAVLAGDESEEELRGLEEDIWLHSGLGCRNVSLLMLSERAAFPSIQPHELHPKYRNNYRQAKALREMTDAPFVDLNGALAIEQQAFPRALSELSYCYYRSIEEVEAWLAEHDRSLQCVVSRCVEHPRRVGFGCAQHPRLEDYPDAVDVVAFLQRL
ncbi:MAG: aldehyde dehydrogenase [Alistipes sp.]|nr:aldehyde dehydrogenase [Alistipes sp.]